MFGYLLIKFRAYLIQQKQSKVTFCDLLCPNKWLPEKKASQFQGFMLNSLLCMPWLQWMRMVVFISYEIVFVWYKNTHFCNYWTWELFIQSTRVQMAASVRWHEINYVMHPVMLFSSLLKQVYCYTSDQGFQ